MASNSYGLDVDFLRKHMGGMLNAIDYYTPEEAARALRRMSDVIYKKEKRSFFEKARLLVWKLRYMNYMFIHSWVGLVYAWRSAEACLENIGEDWKEEAPEYCAEEDMSCWSD